MNVEQQLHIHDSLIVQVATQRASHRKYDADEIAQRTRLLLFENYEKLKNDDGTVDEHLIKFLVTRASQRHYRQDKRDFKKSGIPTGFDVIKEAADATNADDLKPVSIELTLVDNLRELTLSDTKCKQLTKAVFEALYNDPYRTDVDIASELRVADTTVARHRRNLRAISMRKMAMLVS